MFDPSAAPHSGRPTNTSSSICGPTNSATNCQRSSPAASNLTENSKEVMDRSKASAPVEAASDSLEVARNAIQTGMVAQCLMEFIQIVCETVEPELTFVLGGNIELIVEHL